MDINAYAKINLTLDVLYKRPDGYHELESVMHAISLYDTVSIKRDYEISLEADCALPETNTLMSAARLYSTAFGGGASIRLTKRIPSMAGLGGASADGAAVLLGMNRLYKRCDEHTLFELARQVGADVPFCLYALINGGGCALCRGIGERLTPLKSLNVWLVTAKGHAGISTGKLFESLELPVPHPNTRAAVNALERGDVRALCAVIENALEPAASAAQPDIARIRRALSCADAVCMSGSGSAVYGIFPDETAARRAAAGTDAEFCRVVRTV